MKYDKYDMQTRERQYSQFTEVPFMNGASAGKPVFVWANIYVNMFLYITTLGSQENEWSHRNIPSGSVSNTHTHTHTHTHAHTHAHAHAQGCTNPGR